MKNQAIDVSNYKVSNKKVSNKKTAVATRALTALATTCLLAAALPSSAGETLDRIRANGSIKLGYIADSLPFSRFAGSGGAEGYSVELCNQVVDSVKSELGMSQLSVDWVQVTVANHVSNLSQGNIDLLCTPTAQTAVKRANVSYSIPVFPGGVRVLMRDDTAAAIRRALSENPDPKPVWRGSPASKVLSQSSFAVVAGSTTESWLQEKMVELKVDAKIVPVPDYRAGIAELSDRKVDVFFGDRALMLGAMGDGESTGNMQILDRWFTHTPLTLAMPRGDDDFRLLVDSALSNSFSAPGFKDQYSKWCGEYDDKTKTFFEWVSFEE